MIFGRLDVLACRRRFSTSEYLGPELPRLPKIRSHWSTDYLLRAQRLKAKSSMTIWMDKFAKEIGTQNGDNFQAAAG
jgi:hypothetical protein